MGSELLEQLDEQAIERIVRAAEQNAWVANTLARDLNTPPNNSGIYPTDFNVLVQPKAVEEVTKGGIIVPDVVKDRAKYAEMEGRIVALSPAAFSHITEAEWNGQKPAAGDRVVIAKYAGVHVKGDDGVEYVLVKDRDITAVRK